MSNNRQENSKIFLTIFSIKQTNFFPFRGSHCAFPPANAAFQGANLPLFPAFIRTSRLDKTRIKISSAFPFLPPSRADSGAEANSLSFTYRRNDRFHPRPCFAPYRQRRVADARLAELTGRRVLLVRNRPGAKAETKQMRPCALPITRTQ